MNSVVLNKKGFTLIELMVAIAIMGVLMVIAIPHFSSWIVNSRMRNIAEGINVALIRSKNVAITSINENIILTLNGDTSWKIEKTTIPFANYGVNTSVSTIEIAKKSASESSKGVTINVSPAGATIITFNSYGRIVPNLDGSESISSIDVTSTNNIDGVTPLKVIIGKGGASLVCSNPPSPNPSNPTDCSIVSIKDIGG